MPNNAKTKSGKTAGARVPETLTVILADTTATMVALIHENQQRPYARRCVQLKLTDEQRKALKPRFTGQCNGERTYEVHLESWLEPATEALQHEPEDQAEPANRQ